jgi:sugar/nucleoside kinase (ribokinase family)
MITGFDISLDKIKLIRKSYNGIIYFDLHTLSRGVDKNLVRNFRLVPDALEWISNVDIIQCNENELFTLSKATNRMDVINSILQVGLKYLIVTHGEGGAEIIFKEGEEIKSLHRPALQVNVKNKVGCGDIFGAVFFYNYLYHKDIDYSLEQAVNSAGKAVSINILENLNSFLHD